MWLPQSTPTHFVRNNEKQQEKPLSVAATDIASDQDLELALTEN